MALPKVKRGQIWAVDFDPQIHKEEPGKQHRPALVIQTNPLNDAGHQTTIVIPGTSDVESEDCFPLRVALGQLPGLNKSTDLLIDQVRAISNKRFMGTQPIATVSTNHMRRIEEALRILLQL
ncbi:type II toxin-antitoxin system PemK/MazF family toxin [Duganella sp. BJB488]|uniref:type II toxin-antitoxin system PemK/MazF family toxin n=1 Tax=unclassified Duganella TaxID=2636909 RepID=UPI000E350FD8|nr:MULTISPECIES: type II toxin-antitoxin system PemK/MazF family toxin [unclassified Duganella]RFP09233.1 type II toxin-antitoxin system PemK/MazF family toxin [Duganella sp. BJB475]RFP13117.1 type II toxin-antitoxin system PemK/MazF family toxin [Duganella sp. BJB489]RFP17119.1 type II toxin-antitoxin system PemK/MazF family toxin [Duganella sp. BJB488]RFP25459.1 type II toxin-antitoxin system PemK/MazF family toxin [Duganella sp. BJB476]RFP31662.1 type II toxin-antitoxin system PemK/MazF fam